MAKKLGTFFILILFLLGLTGCYPATSSADPAGTETAFSYTFTDSTGYTVTLEAQPQRVAVLFSSYAEIWTLAGGEIAVTVGDSITRGFALEDTPLVDPGAGLKIDLERLAASEPDFVIASADLSAQVEACERLREAGVPCAAFTEESFSDYLTMLRIFTDITGNEDAYENYGTQVQLRVEEVLAEASARAEASTGPVSVLFIRAGSGESSTRAKTAKDHFVGVMLEELGAVNIADAAGALSEHLSLEYVLTAQPDVIFIVTQGDEAASTAYMDSVLEQEGWCTLDAVTSGRCTYLPRDLFHYKPNAKWDEAYQYLTDLLYPSMENLDA